MSAPVSSRPSVVVVGGGFAGFFAARTLERLLPVGAADLTMISATDHMCYSPLLPEVAAGRLDPRRIAVPLHSGLRRARVLQATVEDVDFAGRTLTYSTDCDPTVQLAWDRLAITTGSVTRILPTPGLETHALGLKNLVEAVFVRDHVLRQLELADSTADPEERRSQGTAPDVAVAELLEAAERLACYTILSGCEDIAFGDSTTARPDTSDHSL